MTWNSTMSSGYSSLEDDSEDYFFTARTSFFNKVTESKAAFSDFLQRSSRDLSKHVRVVCDGTDLTPKIQDLKFQCIVFLNIPSPHAVPERLRLRVNRISLHDYDRLQYDKERLRDISVPVGIVVVRGDCDLETCRLYIDRLREDLQQAPSLGHRVHYQDESRGMPRTTSAGRLSPSWSFLDSTSADRFYRIDKAQEHLHFVTEICQDEVFILDHEGPAGSRASSAGMPDLVVEPTAGAPLTPEEQALLTAASAGDLSMLSECVRHGVSLLVRDAAGCSALHKAAQKGHAQLVVFILQQGSKVLLDLPDREKGDTALHKAASEKQHAVCRLLVEAGASLHKTNFQGKTPVEQAAGDLELTSYLSSHKTPSAPHEDLETAV